MIAPLPYAKEHADLWLKVAGIIRPRDRMRPSDWAEANIRLSPEQSPASPGPFRCNFRPWTRALHDLMYDNPTKKGVVCVKPGQIGFTRVFLNYLGYSCLTQPGPFLFLIGKQENARHYSSSHFAPMIRECEALAAIFGDAVKTERTLIQERPYLGGRVDFVGGGSPQDVSSRTYVLAALDELEIVYDNFPADAGDPVKFAEKRLATVKDIGQLWMFSHPRRKSRGIWLQYETISDQRAWMFDCARCGAPVDPTWSCIHIEGLVEAGPRQLEFGRVDPSKSVFRCPTCKDVITDAERCRATWAPREGGSGRFEFRIPKDKAAEKGFIGVHIDGLADPTLMVGELVKELSECTTEESRRTFFNLTLGETMESSEVAVTVEHVRQRLEESRGKLLVPGGRLGAAFLATGVDVQAPKHNPTLYARGECYGPFAAKFITHFDRLSGWDALQLWLETLEVPVQHESGEGVGGRMGCSICSIDCAYETAQVLDFCRRNIHSRVTGAKIILLPVRYRPEIKGDMPAVMPSVQKRTDPARPHLGPMDRWDLNRHHWVDREMRRWQDNRLVVLAPPPPELAAHITANVLRPVETQHGWHSDQLVWELIKDARDDWMQAGAYAEAGAVLRMKADRLMELASIPDSPVDAPEQASDFGGRYRTRSGWYG